LFSNIPHFYTIRGKHVNVFCKFAFILVNSNKFVSILLSANLKWWVTKIWIFHYLIVLKGVCLKISCAQKENQPNNIISSSLLLVLLFFFWAIPTYVLPCLASITSSCIDIGINDAMVCIDIFNVNFIIRLTPKCLLR